MSGQPVQEQVTVVERLARFAAEVRASGMSDDLREDVARRVLDVLGNSLAAMDEPSAGAVTAVVRGWGGPADATAIGLESKVPAAAAALVNGTLAHSLDFDDTHLPSVLHPSSSVIPAVLAAAEASGASGPAMLDAAGVGIEVTVRLGMGGYDPVAGTSEFFERGLHATSICGAVGAAVGVAMVTGLDVDGIANAAGIASSMGAGLLEANRTGGTVKRVHCGWAAHSGVVAADLARHGLTGPPTVIEGRFGFLHAFCGEHANVAAVTADLGTHWELPGIFFKPYPCNHFTHTAADAAMAMRDNGIEPDDVVSMELGAPTSVLRTIAEPAEEKARPRSGYHAAFSGPYVVAAAMIGGGGLGLFHEDFTDEAARDERRLALAAKVTCVPDERCDEIFPHQFPAVLRVDTKDGARHEVRIDTNRGGPQRPLSNAELATKLRLNAARSLPEAQAAALALTGLNLPSTSTVAEVMELVRGGSND